MDRVVLGMDPHKRSATIEVMAADETILGGGRYGTDRDGYNAMLRYARQWPNRVWAIEGCNGIGRHIANRLLADGEQVVDVPPKLSAPARVFATGQGRKTDATDAHSVALVGTRMAGLRPVVNDEQLALLRILVDRRRSLGEDHTRMVAQLHQLLGELIPGGAKKNLSADGHDHPQVFITPDGHWHRRSNFARRLWRPACDGDPDRKWPPILPGAVFHGLRHHHKTVLDELGIEDALKYERMGHRMPGIAGVYSHVTDPMRQKLRNRLQQRWTTLTARRTQT